MNTGWVKVEDWQSDVDIGEEREMLVGYWNGHRTFFIRRKDDLL